MLNSNLTQICADAHAPAIQILSPDAGRPFAGGIKVEWQTSDDLSGELNEWAFIDEDISNALQVVNGSVLALTPGPHTLTVLAEDRAGNASQEEVKFIVYPFEWLPPLSIANPYAAKSGRTVAVKFEVHDLAGEIVSDTSVELRLLDVAGNVVAGPFFFATNPDEGVVIQGNGQYHHNLRTVSLNSGTYTIQITFNSPELGGWIMRTIQLEP